MCGLCLTEIDEEELHARFGVGRVECQLFEDVVDAVGSETDAHAAESGHAEDTCQVVVASASADAAHFGIEGLHFHDASGVVVQTACQCKVEFDGVGGLSLEGVEHGFHLLASEHSRLASRKHLADVCEFLGIRSAEADDGL